jgi:dTDP-4-amino-4,6-dideoxygalactose transaminase
MFENIKQFITEKSGKKYSFITGNGTSAIYLALKAIGLEKGSKIAVPNIACPDPVYALIWAGYKPVFIDVNIDDYNMNIDKLEIK